MPSKVQQLRQRFLLTGAGLALALLVILYWFTSARATQMLEGLANDRGLEVANRASALVSEFLRERRHETQVLATSPAVIRAARQAAQDAAQRNLTGLETGVLERMFSRTRSLGGDPELTEYFRRYPDRSDFAELFFTESHGFNVVTSGRTSDFVQADETWWQRAWATGAFEGEASYDSSAAVVSIEYAVAVRSTPGSRPLGVLKTVFALDRLSRILDAERLGSGASLQVVDQRGRLVVSPDPARLLERLAEGPAAPVGEPSAVTTVTGPAGPELVIAVAANDGRWRVVFRQPSSAAYAAARAVVNSLLYGGLALFAVLVSLLWLSTWWLNRLVTEPVRAAGQIASRVASGDLSVTVVSQRAETAEVGDLLSSVHSMVVALRRLVGAIRAAADEAAAMAAEISASTEQMSASTEEMAATCQDLTRRAADQAQLVRAAADDAGRILQIVTILASGADEAARRNTTLSELARKHRTILEQSTTQLTQLAEEVAQGAAEAEALARASMEIQKFVTQAKAVATQTNMLALNAAIEAARAGPQGRGFAVVADEVRKLAALAAAGAGETADIVRDVLARVQTTRDRLVRLAASGATAREAAQVASQGLMTVAGEADANDAWSREIARSAQDLRQLVEEIASRLATMAQGTDTLLASAEEIAASAQQQSASTQEIASSAGQLAEAADKLTGAIKSFRLLSDEIETKQAAD
ncbi:MAG TPA: methyl-accepting chemotaxis protein [Gemmatimonadales bacterium]